MKKVSFPNGKIVEYKVDAQNRRFKKIINGQVNEYYIWYDHDPTISRWTTKDPIGFNGGDTNLYAYVGGNPMSYIDPGGKAAIAPIIFILAIPTILYVAEEIKEYIECSGNPQKCASVKTLEKMEKEIENNERLFPGQCKPPKGPRPAAPKERRPRKV